MSEPRDRDGARPDRRVFLTALATFAAAGAAVRPAAAEDAALDALMGDTERGQFGQSFDQGSRTIHMPKASAPTLSPATLQTTEKAIETYDAIVSARRLGGGAQGRSIAARRPPSERGQFAFAAVRLRRSRRQRRRQRHLRFLCRGGGAAVPGAPRPHRRRHRARGHSARDERAGGDAARPAQGQHRTAQDADHQSRAALRGLQHPGGAHRGDRERRRGVAAHRRGRQARSRLARHQQQDRRDQLQSVLDRAGLDRAQGFDPENAGSAGLPDLRTTSASSTPSTSSCSPRRSTGTRRTRPITRSSRTPAISTRSARSASTSRAPMASICTTRR